MNRPPATITRSRLMLIAAAMALYIVVVIWPSIDLIRLWLTGDSEAFSIQRMATAIIVALLFGLFAYRMMCRIALPRRTPRP